MREWFPHDFGSRQDPKLQKAQQVFEQKYGAGQGAAAIGIYWQLVEIMHEQSGYIMQADCDSIAYALRTQYERITDVLQAVFEFDGSRYFSNRILRNIQDRNAISEGGRKAALTRWGKMHSQCERNAVAMLDRHTDRQDIQTDKHNTNTAPQAARKVFEAPTVQQVKDYCQADGHQIDAQQFVDFYTSKGWMIGKNKMKDWKAAVRTWTKNKAPSMPVDQQSKPMATIPESECGLAPGAIYCGKLVVAG